MSKTVSPFGNAFCTTFLLSTKKAKALINNSKHKMFKTTFTIKTLFKQKTKSILFFTSKIRSLKNARGATQVHR